MLVAHKEAAEKIKAGDTGRQADAYAREVLTSLGYGKYFTHSLGHGIGVNIHEFPYLSPKGEAALTDGMVFSDEPGVYIDGKFGIRIEDSLREGSYALGAGKIRKAPGRGDIFVYRDIDIALALGIEINLLLVVKPVDGGVESAYIIRTEKRLGSGFHSRIAV